MVFARKGMVATSQPLAAQAGQIIWRNSEGVLAGATESRTDGFVAVW